MDCCPVGLTDHDIRMASQEIVAELMRSNQCSAKDINNGSCHEFAFQLMEKLNLEDACRLHITYEKEEGGHIYYHMTIKVCDKYYDAEAVKGVTDYRDLPIIEVWREHGLHEVAVETGVPTSLGD